MLRFFGKYCFLVLLGMTSLTANAESKDIHFDFYGDSIYLHFKSDKVISFQEPLSQKNIQEFTNQTQEAGFDEIGKQLFHFKKQFGYDDWLFYQLIRKTAQLISPKQNNYHQYTLYKWLFLTASGYDSFLTFCDEQILFYVKSNESIFNIPYRIKNGSEYYCLNYHDYGSINFEEKKFVEAVVNRPFATNEFSYKITTVPTFKTSNTFEKDVQFSYNNEDYNFKMQINPEVSEIYKNYPTADYALYFNMPLSQGIYASLIPELKKYVSNVDIKTGVEFLMNFTRYAFIFKNDSETYGCEKRYNPLQTLNAPFSDCEDRAALFYALVKEIYNLPMIVLAYPKHVTIAVKFKKPFGTTITYNGEKYTVCEATSQRTNLAIGQLPEGLKHQQFEIGLVYQP